MLGILGNLPYRLIIPLSVRAAELLDFSDQEWRPLDAQGMITHDLTPAEVAQAFALKERHRVLSANDCFCFVTALATRGIVLTGDVQLRRAAASEGLRVHGVLWVIDELAVAGACTTRLLVDALRVWQSDSAVFLPRHEISNRLEALVGSL